jgi:hypothetical protein
VTNLQRAFRARREKKAIKRLQNFRESEKKRSKFRGVVQQAQQAKKENNAARTIQRALARKAFQKAGGNATTAVKQRYFRDHFLPTGEMMAKSFFRKQFEGIYGEGRTPLSVGPQLGISMEGYSVKRSPRGLYTVARTQPGNQLTSEERAFFEVPDPAKQKKGKRKQRVLPDPSVRLGRNRMPTENEVRKAQQKREIEEAAKRGRGVSQRQEFLKRLAEEEEQKRKKAQERTQQFQVPQPNYTGERVPNPLNITRPLSPRTNSVLPLPKGGNKSSSSNRSSNKEGIEPGPEVSKE